jgi:Flp pilus assembly pilin Flp
MLAFEDVLSDAAAIEIALLVASIAQSFTLLSDC